MPRRPRIPFTEEETANLIKGMKEFGDETQKWRRILLNYNFDSRRTSVDLKDKWRNLCREKPPGGNNASVYSHAKVPWAAEEVELLRRGFAEFGQHKNPWSSIMQKYGTGFHSCRTGTSLKDKWRNLSREEEKRRHKRQRVDKAPPPEPPRLPLKPIPRSTQEERKEDEYEDAAEKRGPVARSHLGSEHKAGSVSDETEKSDDHDEEDDDDDDEEEDGEEEDDDEEMHDADDAQESTFVDESEEIEKRHLAMHEGAVPVEEVAQSEIVEDQFLKEHEEAIALAEAEAKKIEEEQIQASKKY